jgi:hypothetical protein
LRYFDPERMADDFVNYFYFAPFWMFAPNLCFLIDRSNSVISQAKRRRCSGVKNE